MALAKSTRLWLILVIDLVFFLIELVVGSAVGSLALIADSFHMLNDVLSVVVALRAVKLANQSSSKNYTYGWQRAETLGALINGVFLVALCVTIFLQAIERFVEPPKISHPELVLVVGSCGLVFNILGLFLFHQHTHGHGNEGDQPRRSDQAIAAEEGQNASIGPPATDGHTAAVADQGGSVVDVLPQIATGAWSSGSPKRHSGLQFDTPNPDQSPSETGHSPVARRISRGSKRQRRKDSSLSRRATSINEFTHPAEMRQSIIEQAKSSGLRPDSSSDSEEDLNNANGINESSPLLSAQDQKKPNGYRQHQGTEIQHDSWHTGHKHKTHQSGGGHSHGDMNTRGIFLHVMGDALGNLGVIASAIFIWRTNFSWKNYADPVISLLITVIILTSAIPLCKAASRILLQAVPTGISVDDIQDDIEDLEGVLSCHHVHVWGLSETKMVASLHVQVDCDIRQGGSAGYMEVARKIRDCLHGYGIHNSTIQPEFMPHGDHVAQNGGATTSGRGVGRLRDPSRQGSRAGSLRSGTRECLLECEEGCGEDQQCCVPSNGASDDEAHVH